MKKAHLDSSRRVIFVVLAGQFKVGFLKTKQRVVMYLKRHGKGSCEGTIGCTLDTLSTKSPMIDTYLSKHSKKHTIVKAKKKFEKK